MPSAGQEPVPEGEKLGKVHEKRFRHVRADFPGFHADTVETHLNIIRTSDLLMRAIARYLRPHGLTPPAMGALIFLDSETEPVPMSVLKKQFVVTQANITGIVDTLEKIMEYILDLLKRIDRVAFILIDPETEKILDVVSKSKKPGVDTYCADVVKRVLEDRKPVAFFNVQTEEEGDLVDTLKIMKIESVMCLPMFIGSQPTGLVYVDSLGRPHGFRKEDLSLFVELSQMISLAIQRDRLPSEPKTGAGNLHLDA